MPRLSSCTDFLYTHTTSQRGEQTSGPISFKAGLQLAASERCSHQVSENLITFLLRVSSCPSSWLFYFLFFYLLFWPVFFWYYLCPRISPACWQTMINKRYTITYDHWVGPHSPKPLLLLLPVIRNLTAVPTAHVRAHIGMRTLHYSHISKTTSVQTRLTLPQATSFPFLPPPFSPFLSPTTSLFASHFMLPLREKSHYFWFRGSYCPPLLHVMPVASLLQHHKRIWSSDLSARGNGSLEEWGVGENRDQERELKREGLSRKDCSFQSCEPRDAWISWIWPHDEYSVFLSAV